jgi:flavin-binding protein dodecin
VEKWKSGKWKAKVLRDCEEIAMSNHVYKTIELVGSSAAGSDEAVRNAIARASATMRNLRWFQVMETRGHIEDGQIGHWQVTLKVGFTLDEP